LRSFCSFALSSVDDVDAVVEAVVEDAVEAASVDESASSDGAGPGGGPGGGPLGRPAPERDDVPEAPDVPDVPSAVASPSPRSLDSVVSRLCSRSRSVARVSDAVVPDAAVSLAVDEVASVLDPLGSDASPSSDPLPVCSCDSTDIRLDIADPRPLASTDGVAVEPEAAEVSVSVDVAVASTAVAWAEAAFWLCARW
jgi:hypothetical protein